ncbi:hypothetical protein HH308_11505 [Gordonia sp. TBRC 11910]|uniref:Uncharacterized protein n=1 Tax=Gordonia asplenii TaxID=2725283 RepID=A0A848KUX9_9ACTN|nr:DUF6188 family protein [Gordonia asplenii]NMO01837.1 hypothetical protein [Gordonia asplenii]
MRPLPIAGSRIAGIRADYTIHIYTDSDYELVIEAPMSMCVGDDITVVDPTQGEPDQQALRQLIGRTIDVAMYSDRNGLLLRTDDRCVYSVPPIEDFESWQCVGPDCYAIGVPSNTL